MKKQGFLLSSAILAVTVIITKILGLIYKIPLTNLLGGTGFGYYTVAYSVFMPMFSISVSGISSSMSRIIAENAAFERYKNIRKIRRVSLGFFSLVGLAFTIVNVLVAVPVCLYIVCVPSAVWSVVAISPCIFIGAILSVERGYYEGLRNMTPTAVSEIAEGIFKILFGLGFAYYATKNADRFFIKGLPFVSAMAILGVTFSNLISVIILWFTRKIKGDGITKLMIDADASTEQTKDILKKILKISLPISVSALITTLGAFVDTITINRSLSFSIKKAPEAFTSKFGLTIASDTLPNFIYGSYSGIALTIFGLIPSMTSIFGKTILPLISEEYSKGNKRIISDKINSVLFITSIIAIPSALGIYTFSDEIMFTLFPSITAEIIACSDSLKILCTGMIFLCMAMPVYSIVQTIMPPKTAVRIMLCSCIVKMVLNILLVTTPALNILGASIATTVSYAIIFLWSVFEILRLKEIKISYRRIFVKPFFAAFLCVSSARLCFDFIKIYASDAVSLGFSVISGVIIYIFSLYLLSVLTKNELKQLFFE